MRALDITGNVFDRLTVLSRTNKEQNKNKKVHWLCKCECGVEVVARGDHLRLGKIKSCGCLSKEINSAVHTTHGHNTKTSGPSREYRTWQHIKGRCLTPTDKAYQDYGGRGITVCEEWSKDFTAFLRDMGKCPEGLTIDRIDNSKGYSKENCRWTDIFTQARNKRNNSRITFRGESLISSEWSERTGIPSKTIEARLSLGWSVIKSLIEPVRCNERLITIGNETLCVTDWAKKGGIHPNTLRARLLNGEYPESAVFRRVNKQKESA